jgi:predicted 2-oxoglutarate/Fe(II)-dependent dioxygenase YbiX
MLDLTAPLVWTIPEVLSREECAELIARIESNNPSSAPISTSTGFVMRPDIRNNDRTIFDDPELAAELFDRVRREVPPTLFGRVPCGANERFRCYRYDVGHKFSLHGDGAFVRSPTEGSLLTFMVYLNEGFEGGETDFPDLETRIVPKTGMALLFQHPLLHEGCEVLSGTKYVLRSDVMYSKP